MLRKVVPFALAAVLAACTPDPPATSAQDAEAKRFAAAPGMGAIYVTRGGDPYMAYGVALSIDGRPLGTIGRGDYASADVTPGRHRLSCAGQDAPYAFDVVPGQLVFVDLLLTEGPATARCTAIALDPLNGRERVSAGRRVVPRG